MGSELNPSYDLCIANYIIDGLTSTIARYVDNFKISHHNPAVVTKIFKDLRSTSETANLWFVLLYFQGFVNVSLNILSKMSSAEQYLTHLLQFISLITKVWAYQNIQDLCLIRNSRDCPFHDTYGIDLPSVHGSI
jgi:hypothetical protein